jgi:hypothetical protein
MNRNVWAIIVFSAAQLIFADASSAIAVGQIDNFQDGTTSNWSNGNIIGTVSVTNIATGGPAGAGDRYIQVTADGSTSGGKLTSFNRDQWLGDYVAAGITAIDVDLGIENIRAVPEPRTTALLIFAMLAAAAIRIRLNPFR